MHKLFQSSKNPQKLSMTVQGVLVSFVPVLLGVFKVLDVPITESMLMDIVQGISALLATVLMLYGAIRKAVNAFQD